MLHPQQIYPSRISRVVKLTRLITLTLFVSLIGLSAARAQTSNIATIDRAKENASLRTYPEKVPDDPFKARLIPRNSTSASMAVTNLRTGVVAYADSSDRSSANRGLRSSAEKLAKYLKRKIEDDEKKQQ